METIRALVEWFGESQGVAAWVQAIGAIIALYIAIQSPVWFAKRERANRAKTLLVVCDYVAELLEEVNDAFQKGSAHYNGYVEFNYNPGVWRQALADLNSFPIYEVDSKSAGYLLGLRALFGNAVSYYDMVPKADGDDAPYDDQAEVWARYADAARAAVNGLKKEM